MKKIILAAAFSPLLFANHIQEISGFQSPESVFVNDNAIYVSNLGAEIKPMEKDGDGSIIKLDKQGNILSTIKGLDAPKGMEQIGNILYVSDIDTLKGIDLQSQKVVFSLPIQGSVFLNDVVKKDKNTLLISDTGTGIIYEINLSQKSYTKWIKLDSNKYGGGPNGLLVHQGELYTVTYDPNQKAKGMILKINLKNKKVQQFSKVRGFLDGIALDKNGNFLVSAWGDNLAGVVYQITPKGKSKLLNLRPIKGCADIFYTNQTLYIPAMVENKILEIKDIQ